MVESTEKAEEQPQVEEESPATKVKRNWAEGDDADEEDAEKDIGGSGAIAKASQEQEQKKFIPPKTKREKNAFGDFVVNKIVIREKEVPQTVNNEDEEEESEEESDSEPEPQNEPEEEKKSK